MASLSKRTRQFDYDAVSDTIRRRGENRGIFRKKEWIQWHILGEITDLEFENH